MYLRCCETLQRIALNSHVWVKNSGSCGAQEANSEFQIKPSRGAGTACSRASAAASRAETADAC